MTPPTPKGPLGHAGDVSCRAVYVSDTQAIEEHYKTKLANGDAPMQERTTPGMERRWLTTTTPTATTSTTWALAAREAGWR